MQALIVLSLSLVFCCSFVACTYSNCGSDDGELVSVAVSGCDSNARRCILKRNTNASLEITFSSKVKSEKLNAIVHGVILGVPMPFDLPNPDGCKDSGLSCPVEPNQNYKYVATLPILGSYPRVTVDIKWELKDDNDKDIICALIPAKIS